MRITALLFAAALLPLVLGTGCGGKGDPVTQADADLSTLIGAYGLTGDPMAGRNPPDISQPLPQLGMRLFFSKSLGGDRDSSCASCHHPFLGGGDGLPLPIGVDAQNPDLLGPGRLHATGSPGFDGGPTVPRNAPTTFNLAGWDQVLFHDGRVESLMKTKGANGAGSGIRTPDSAFGVADPLAGGNLPTAQARFPVTSPEEMKAFALGAMNNQQTRDYLASRVGGYGGGAGELPNTFYWLNQFRTAFNSPAGTAPALITEQNIALAIGEYERSQVLVDNPWNRYVKGDRRALTDEQKRGALLFYTPVGAGGGGCASCHSGDFFTDERFHNLAMPQIGRGKGDGVGGTNDRGRFRETGLADDDWAFRTPSLLNVAVTGPWSHSGAYTTLEAVVRHHLDPAAAIAAYDTGQLGQPGVQNLALISTQAQDALFKLGVDRINGRDVLQNAALSDTQVAELVAFLHALTDPCATDAACLSKWVPDPVIGADPNLDQLNASFTIPVP